ncbi:MAG TPA: type II toxin-antitoxin system prevent-host-death family antitoxin [Ilumatobacteraceae bacterium]|nr:type II toxin-antitoxin system prevent-host-death family antitoxin [Ilumatobacteraceae bacterium]
MIGIRELRADLAAHVRRAASGETTVISIAGSPAAALTPLAMSNEPPGAAQLSSLVASGALIAPRRSDGRTADGTVSTWANVRLDRLLREIRG